MRRLMLVALVSLACAGPKGQVIYEVADGDVLTAGLSRDLAHWYAVVKTADGKIVVVTDGNPGKTYDGISEPVFSPDSKHLACRVKTGLRINERWAASLDGKVGPWYDAAWGPCFTPDGKVGYIGRKGKKLYLVAESVS